LVDRRSTLRAHVASRLRLVWFPRETVDRELLARLAERTRDLVAALIRLQELGFDQRASLLRGRAHEHHLPGRSEGAGAGLGDRERRAFTLDVTGTGVELVDQHDLRCGLAER